MVQEGCPYIAALCATQPPDVWSARNMLLSPDGGATPAPRHEGDRKAQYAADRSGMVFRGKLDIPVIDWRHYLEPFLDMHNSHQSFAARQRLLNYDGDASNQVIWFTAVPAPGAPGVRFDQTPQALLVLDRWLANIADHPERGVAGNKPADAVDSCFNVDGSLLARGRDVWGGILDAGPKGECAAAFPPFGTSRTVAGGPIEGGIFKCQTQSVRRAISRDLYGSWHPTAAERARLEQIFPSGVCDYRKPDAGLPPEFRHGHK
jgi:hypothetical protein